MAALYQAQSKSEEGVLVNGGIHLSVEFWKEQDALRINLHHEHMTIAFDGGEALFLIKAISEIIYGQWVIKQKGSE